MKLPPLALSILALAVCAGCAQPRSSSTAAMGAGPAPQTVMCRDAAWVSNASDCGSHGGVERVMGSPAK